MYRKQISRKTFPLNSPTSVNRKPAPTKSFAPLSNVVQRAQQDPNSVSGEEWQALHSTIGTRAVREIVAGKKTPWVPELKGISAQLWGDSGQVSEPIQAKVNDNVKEPEEWPEHKTPRVPEYKRRTVWSKKPGQNRAHVQGKHPIGAVGDKYEQEADRVAAQVEKPTQLQTANPPRENLTGMPDRLKAGLEQLSGLDLSGVRVHYNSAKPAQLNAHAYTQGQVIELGPGQERHLPHEAWHVVQQAEGRVKPTESISNGTSVNDDQGLETEADVMGALAMQRRTAQKEQQTDRNNVARDKQAQLRKQSKKQIGDRHAGPGYLSTKEVGKHLRRIARADDAQQVIQGKLMENKLNVAGETHAEYLKDPQVRRDERVLIVSHIPGGNYWEEPQFMVEKGYVTAADPEIYQYYSALHYVLQWTKRYDKFLDQYNTRVLSLSPNIVRARDKAEKLIQVAKENFRKALSIPGKFSYPGFTTKEAQERRNLTTGAGRTYAALYTIEKSMGELEGLRGDADRQLRISSGFRRTRRRIGIANENLQVTPRENWTLKRSQAMHRAAQEYHETRGVWKIGEEHVRQIMEIVKEELEVPDYNLLTEEEFLECTRQLPVITV